jgi:hypothetical protein
MGIEFGSKCVGRVDEIGGGHIGTKFFMLGVKIGMPIFPMRSLWIFGDEGNERAVRTRLSWRSVLVAYLRWWLPVAALGPAIQAWDGDHGSAFLVGGVLLAWVGAQFLWKSPRGQRREKLVDLWNVVGLPIDPGLVRPEMRSRIREDLTQAVRKAGLPDDAQALSRHSLPTSIVPVVHALACYSSEAGQEGWRAITRRLDPGTRTRLASAGA